jgi:hypothetical protein
VIFLLGNGRSEFFIAAETLSLDSFTAESGSPTIRKTGTAFSKCVSISTGKAEIPKTDPEYKREYIHYP